MFVCKANDFLFCRFGCLERTNDSRRCLHALRGKEKKQRATSISNDARAKTINGESFYTASSTIWNINPTITCTTIIWVFCRFIVGGFFDVFAFEKKNQVRRRWGRGREIVNAVMDGSEWFENFRKANAKTQVIFNGWMISRHVARESIRGMKQQFDNRGLP